MAPRKTSSSANALPLPFSTPTPQHDTKMSPPESASATKRPSSSGKTSKTPKSKTIILKLSPKSLAKFPHDSPSPPDVKSESSSSSPAEDIKKTATAPSISETPAVASTPDVSTPAPDANGLLAPPSNGSKRKGVPGPKPGVKRTASQLDLNGNGDAKPRGRPGPKKKARIGENGETLPVTATAGPKLGPKANAGAINACLRALDRTGKPCRKWTKAPFRVRSFTGYTFGAGTYAALKRADGGFAGDVKSDESSNGDGGSGDKPSGTGDSRAESVSTPLAVGVAA